MKTYRGSPAAARNYVEAGLSRADDYYLREGTGIAERYVAGPDIGVEPAAPLFGDAYEAWVAGVDPETGAPKGRLRSDENAVRFVEVTVNGPKSWSLAAELHPDISVALNAAQDDAAKQIIGWLAHHSTTRVGPRGKVVQVPVARLEAVTVRHYTSRAGDPHRHLHLQVNSRVFAEGKWRALHTVGFRDSLDAINGIGHAAVATNPGFRAALAAHGFTLTEGGEITQLAPFVGAFSARATQIGRNLDRIEAEWRAANPGHEPGPALRRAWDAQAWAMNRPDKIHPTSGEELTQRWVRELHDLGYRPRPGRVPLATVSIGSLDRDLAVDVVLSRLTARRSGWNAADIRGEVEQFLARHDIIADPAVRLELAEDLTARILTRCISLLDRTGVPEHIRALTSPAVLEVEADLTTRLAARADEPTTARSLTQATVTPNLPAPVIAGRELDDAQARAAVVLAGRHELVVVEGAAGAGKTSTLSAARDLLHAQSRRLTVVTPTLKAAKVAQAELHAQTGSAAWLVFQHGYRWNQHGHWTRLQPGDLDPVTGATYSGPRASAMLRAGDLLLVDEAGMLDQDTARALLTLADQHHTRIALVGDRHQLAAVGRGGVLDLAARWVQPDAHVTLDTVHRFTTTNVTPDGTSVTMPDTEYADLSLAMRTGDTPEQVFQALTDRGQIHLHAGQPERLTALADLAAGDVTAGRRTVVVADTREQVAELNTAIRDRLVTANHVQDSHTVATDAGQNIGVGDRVVTRHNNSTLDVANRDSWTVTHVHPDGSIEVTGQLNGHPGRAGVRRLPAGYVAEHVELGYASTVYGVQGDTAAAAHLLLGEHTGAASAYVGMTRGRETNVAHLVAEDLEQAREQWVAAFARDRADLGPAHAAQLAAKAAANYAQPRPVNVVLLELRAAWTLEQQALDRLMSLTPKAKLLHAVADTFAERDATLPALEQDYRHAVDAAARARAQVETTENVVAYEARQLRAGLERAWVVQRPAAVAAAQTVAAGPGRFRQHRAEMADARAVLQTWGDAWRPYLLSLPADPDQLAGFAGRRDDRARLDDAFTHLARTSAEQQHPEHAAARQVLEQTRARERDSGIVLQRAADHYAARLARHGNYSRITDPAAAVRDIDQLITYQQQHLHEARTGVEAIERDPAVLTQPGGWLTLQRARWQQERNLELAAATTHRNAAIERRPAGPYHAYDRPMQTRPEHGHGISR